MCWWCAFENVTTLGKRKQQTIQSSRTSLQHGERWWKGCKWKYRWRGHRQQILTFVKRCRAIGKQFTYTCIPHCFFQASHFWTLPHLLCHVRSVFEEETQKNLAAIGKAIAAMEKGLSGAQQTQHQRTLWTRNTKLHGISWTYSASHTSDLSLNLGGRP